MRNWYASAALAVVGVSAIGLTTATGSGTSGHTTLVSQATDGSAGNHFSSGPAISENGRFIAFGSIASNLVPDDTNGYADVFVRDLETSLTELVSVDSSGNQTNLTSGSPAISADGRFVAFLSAATNLTLGASDVCDIGTGSCEDVFVRDRVTGSTELVSVTLDGAAANHNNWSPSISGDGRYVTFVSGAGDLVADDGPCQGSDQCADVFVRNMQDGTTSRVNLGPGGVQADGSTFYAMISADGRFVTFDSRATNLVASLPPMCVSQPPPSVGPSPTPSPLASPSGSPAPSPPPSYCVEVYIRDLLTEQTTLASTDSAGNPANWHAFQPSVSANGRILAFWSQAGNLVPDDTNDATDVFVHDRETGITQRVSVQAFGGQIDVSCRPHTVFPPACASISSDGRFVTFESSALDVAGDANSCLHIYDPFFGASYPCYHIYVHDRATGVTLRVTVNDEGQQANDDSGDASIGGGGRYIAFSSDATNLVPGTDSAGQVYLRDQGAIPPTLSPLTTSQPTPTATPTLTPGAGTSSEASGTATLTHTPTPTPTPTTVPLTPTPTPTSPPGIAKGDVNCDGDLNSVDALYVLLTVAQLPVPGLCGATLDMNCTGAPDSLDALLVLLYVAELGVPEYPDCAPLGV